MKEIIILSDYRKLPEASEYYYECGACHNDCFILIGDGTIECSQCGDIIENLTHNGGE